MSTGIVANKIAQNGTALAHQINGMNSRTYSIPSRHSLAELDYAEKFALEMAEKWRQTARAIGRYTQSVRALDAEYEAGHCASCGYDPSPHPKPAGWLCGPCKDLSTNPRIAR